MIIDEKIPANIVCEACGKDFSCGAETGECWCFEIKIPTARLENLKAEFKNCLCPQCLENEPISQQKSD